MHAYLILAHRSTEQLKALVLYLEKHGRVYIHIDAKAVDVYEDLAHWLQNINSDNIILLQDRVKVYWGHYSQVKATIKLLKAAWKDNNTGYTLMSGECFPVTGLTKFIEHLNSGSANYMAFNSQENMRSRSDNINLFIENNIFSKNIFLRKLSSCIGNVMRLFGIRNKTFDALDIYKGSQWFTLSNDIVDWLLTDVMIEDLIEKFKYSICIDEIFFQTIIANSKWRTLVNNNNLFYILWDGKKNPKYLSVQEEFPHNIFFARKFNMNSNEIEFLLEKLMDGKFQDDTHA